MKECKNISNLSTQKTEINPDNQKSNNDSILPLLLGIVASIGLLMILVFKTHKHKVLKEVIIAMLILGIFVLAYFLMKSIKK